MAVTFGLAGVPSQKTINLDAFFSTTMAKIQKVLEDQISTSNSFFLKVKQSGNWKTGGSGTNMEIPLLYALQSAGFYSGYDELRTDPIDGVTRAIYKWRNMSAPISISGDEETENASSEKLIDLLGTKIKQAMLGMEETWSKAWFQGNGINAGNLYDPVVDAVTGASGFLPLPALVDYDPTASRSVGNINQNTSTWWRNQSSTSTATTTLGLIQEIETIVNNCSKGPGGKPDIAVCDQTTYELLKIAIYNRVRHDPSPVADWPFENFKFRGIMFVWDEFMVDPANAAINTTTAGTIYFLNSKFFEVRYFGARNFNQRPFQTPHNQDAKVSHIMWKGATAVSNRRKHGVLGSIARTLTVS
jgi:hypothetical protein